MIEHENFDLTEYNSYKVNSTCSKVYFPECEDDVRDVFTNEKNIILLGSGHNIILAKSHYDQPFVILDKTFGGCNINRNTGEVVAESGVWMFDLSISLMEAGLSGLEMFYDIPSSLGGAVVMNAGASGEEIKDYIKKVRFLDLADNQFKELNAEELNFKYRNSFFQQNKDKIILKTWLQLNKGNNDEIMAKMTNIRNIRWAKQPKDFPNAGSVFKRPKGKFVGPMLDELGLKGYTVGGAQVSKKHSGFIVNFNNATGEDILGLIKDIQEKVMEKFDVHLEVEQRII